jgi:uncharacterized protein YdhG (YjbR/CyaY superfamily)
MTVERDNLWGRPPCAARTPAASKAWDPGLLAQHYRTRRNQQQIARVRVRQKDEISMIRTHSQSVDDYIASHPDSVRAVLELLRCAIRKALPRADEVVSYNMPAYKLHGEVVIYFAGWKQHYSLYPADEFLVAAFKDELSRYKVEKGTIRFALSEPVPVKLIEQIARFRAKEANDRKSERA